ncbi:hypothetical protein F5Y09DRAFT_354474 [Xylaria sp. FL1042]|nr:hypothetical protein F5Y09DRAFT_354474 [Xylaria sp. FL1042]
MQLSHLLHLTFITGALSARRDPRQVIVTVTAAVSPLPEPAPSPIPLSAPPVPWEQSPGAVASDPIPTAVPVPSFSSAHLSLPPSASSSSPKTASPTPASGGPGPSTGAKCGKGYTYCGYMLTGVGHSTSIYLLTPLIQYPYFPIFSPIFPYLSLPSSTFLIKVALTRDISSPDFAPADIDKSYCNGLPELCPGGKPKTNVDQAVYVCMEDQPSTVQLLCACSGTCLNNATSNYIAHCDKPCVNN